MLYTSEGLKKYKENDWILKLLNEDEDEISKEFRSDKWLRTMDNKRMIYADMYGDLLKNKTKDRVLDVGGGLSLLTKKLLLNTEYYLLDFFAHDDLSKLKEIEARWGEGRKFIIQEEWSKIKPEKYDIVIANDIFPDVDQRLEIFVDTYLPYCKEMRLLLTFYNSPKWYMTKRTDDTELLTFLSWDGEITALKLKKYLNCMNISEQELEELKNEKDSIFNNGRQVCYIKLKGKL